MRMTTSVGPPAASATTMRIGRVGYPCADAAVACARRDAQRTTNIQRARLMRCGARVEGACNNVTEMPRRPCAGGFPLAALVCALLASPALGQQYPTRSIRVVVGFAAGGATDISARILAQKLSEIVGQQVVVDNRPGASANLAGEIVARSPPDGHT